MKFNYNLEIDNILNKIYKKKLLNAEEKLFLKCHDGLITLQLSDIIYIQTEMFSTFNTATEIWNSYAVQGRL